MDYTFFGSDGDIYEYSSLDALNAIIDYPLEYWTQNQGSGDSAIQVEGKDWLLFFKLAEGFFIMEHPTYLAPIIHKNTKVKWLEHLIGSEPMRVPNYSICDKAQAYDIFKYYIENGKLTPQFEWLEF